MMVVIGAGHEAVTADSAGKIADFDTISFGAATG